MIKQRNYSKLLMAWNYFEYSVKMEIQKIINLFVTASDVKDSARYVTKKWIKFYDKPEKN